MTDLIAKGLCIERNGRGLVQDASFGVQQGELVVVLGPNGAGKTSMLRGAIGLEPTASGTVFLGGKDLASIPSLDRAREISYLPQIRPLAWPNTVRDIVALGRFAYGAGTGSLNDVDRVAVERAIKDCDLSELSHRQASTLSGGELARVHCARAFAGETPLLVADEPTASLDPRHRFGLMDLFKHYVDRGGGVLLVLHDIQLAAKYATRLIWMRDGKIVADGPPNETLNEERLANVYGVQASIDSGKIDILGQC